MTFKTQQILRTKVPLKTVDGRPVKPGTRVAVMKMVEQARVRVKVMDPALPELKAVRLISGVGAFKTTHAGRPRK